MKVDLRDCSNDKLRDMREGIVRMRCWFDGYKAGRNVPGATPCFVGTWEFEIVQVQLLLDKLITGTNPK